MPTIAEILAGELNVPVLYVENVVRLLDEGNTIPFIARYRKELHGSMDDTTLRALEERLAYLRSLQQRRQEVLRAIEAQGKLTEQLTAAVENARTLAEVEDVYRPYKQKRRTRATVAREKGLTPLAELLLAQGRDCPAPEQAAAAYIDPEKGVASVATPCRAPMTSWRRYCRTMPPSERLSGGCCSGRGGCAALPQRRRTRFTACTMISSSPCPNWRDTRF